MEFLLKEPVKFQVYSNIHLEICHRFSIKKEGNVLCLCGDIGYPRESSYKDFIDKVSQQFELVLILSGNHEYYDKKSTMERIDAKIEEICRPYNNVFYMNSFSITLVPPEGPRYKVIGTTLWTKIFNEKIKHEMNDYHYIYVEDNDVTFQDQNGMGGKNKRTRLSLSKINSIHEEQMEYIKNSINEVSEEGTEIVVLTHHCPSKDLVKTKDELTEAYACDVDFTEFPFSKVKYWFYGHTHEARDVTIGNTRVYSNPVGYPHEFNVVCKHEIVN